MSSRETTTGNAGLILPGNTVQNFASRVTNADVLTLATSLLSTEVTDLEAIDLQQNRIGEVDEADPEAHLSAIRALAKLFLNTVDGYKCVLVRVDLSGNEINSDCISILCTALRNNKTIKSLNLRRNPMGNEGGMFVAEMLEGNTCLEALDIGDTDLGHGSLIAMATALSLNESISSINLDNPLLRTLEEEALQHLGKMLQNNSTLTHVSLCKHHISDIGAQVLAERLLDNKTLTSLHLRANKIGGFGSEALAALLLSGSRIVELDLTANRMTDEGAKAFETVLSASETLETLCLGYNSIEDDGLARLAHGVLRNDSSGLKKLLVWGNDFGANAPRAFDALHAQSARKLHMDILTYTVDGTVMIAKKIADED
ncbi:hypothetical protein SPRG_02963 [Saprolegnia parasitica CBS 223.65]|uniref:RNI-like protein n=1 Tax=Saprolegnia parasitica (strain CBS 223.65) TaxID=695850 RepID=A0A067D123_SAPPC|nr:hypothetical protein SPRG_02963 [Saprolegnia parasitica CBS 223.65]KDO32486.1 hypothetical protein SPRG_02963 [Saprolegnia parasitica CBS 223.65]|eukprot:XP_012196935.1 hypothetical protein SPRG_02963 [Saprolegnia parasitica CBS 223.65]